MMYFELRCNDMYTKKKKLGALQFLDCGKIHVNHGWRHKARFLECYELLVVMKGTLHITVDEKPFTFSGTHLFLIPPYHEIKGHYASEDETAFYWIDFIIENVEDLSIPAPMKPIKIVNNSTLLPFLRMLCESNFAESDQPNIQESLLMTILYYGSINKSSNPVNTLVSQVTDFIDNHLSEPLTAQSVAEALNYNKDYISRSIQKTTGFPLKEYIIRRKMDTARTLLRTSVFSIDEIAKQIGYANSNLFTKFFTYHQHTSPTLYRKRGD